MRLLGSLLVAAAAAATASVGSQQPLQQPATTGGFRAFTDPTVPSASLRVKEHAPDSPLCVAGAKQYTGWLDVAEERSLFYWFFESQNDPANDPLLLWLTGGPGGSSLIALFMENGPCRITADNTTVVNPWSWSRNASIIFLDQPASVGFSYNWDEENPVAGLETGAKDFYAFLKLFLGSAFPQYADNALHITGESFAGHYVPVYTLHALEHEDPVNISSIFIGNAYVDGLATVVSQYDMFCQADIDLGPGGEDFNVTLPILNEEECASLAHNTTVCEELASVCHSLDPKLESTQVICVAALTQCEAGGARGWLEKERSFNPFDIRVKCVVDNGVCYEQTVWIEAHLNKPETKAALGVDAAYQYNSSSALIEELWQKDYREWLPTNEQVRALVEKGLPVLFYNGDVDAAVPSSGQRRWLDALPWSKHVEFQAELYKTWRGGTFKGVDNLWYAQVAGSGHMVPTDQPEAASWMVEKWLFAGLEAFAAEFAS